MGTGKPPPHLSLIERDAAGKGRLVVSAPHGTRTVAFGNEAEMLAALQRVIERRIPLSVGGHAMGPADEAGFLFDAGKLRGPYLQISWTKPGSWTVHEIDGHATEWDQVEAAELVAASFEP